MTAAMDLDQRRKDRSEQVEQLRRRIAEVSGRMGSGASRSDRADPPVETPKTLLDPAETPLGPDADTLPMLPKGTVAVLSGARSLGLRMVAAATAAGEHVAIVGQPGVGLLAAVEMGADLSRVAVIPDPGPDPVEVAAVLLDGLDLVMLALHGRSVPMSRARAVTARARQKGCTLLITDGDWQGASARLDARVCGYEMAGAGQSDPVPGRGRISRVRLATRSRGRIPGQPRIAVGG